MRNLSNLMKQAATSEWFKALENKSMQTLFVGGCVRDIFFNKESKDVDLLVQGLTLDEIKNILMPFGQVIDQLVGGKMATLKFAPENWDGEEIDVVIPRTEKKVSEGHHGFEMVLDPFLPIEADLIRRDFTLNAMCMNSKAELIDPCNGLEDLVNRRLRMVNPSAFQEDPLRMMRAVNFAARFGLNIEPNTLTAIQTNASTINQISGERIMVELDKVTQKGDCIKGIIVLINTRLFEHIFNKQFNQLSIGDFGRVTKTSEFVFLCMQDKSLNEILDVWKNKLKGDNDGTKEITMLHKAFNNTVTPDLLLELVNILPTAVKLRTLPLDVRLLFEDMEFDGLPFSLKDLKINGNDLLEMGFEPKSIGTTLKMLLSKVANKKLLNDKKELVDFLVISSLNS